MHETVFDSLSRAMGAGVSRREMVRVVAGGALSLGLGHLALDDADAKKHRRHRKKRKRRADRRVHEWPRPHPPQFRLTRSRGPARPEPSASRIDAREAAMRGAWEGSV